MNNFEMRLQRTINQNPIEITINRTEKKEVDGHFEEVTSQHGPYVVCIYAKNTSVPQTVSTLAGTKQVDESYILIGDKNIDIKSGSNVKDEFDIDYGHFLITAVYPVMVKGQLIGYQASLEKVS